tara:strand:+ start:2013 stop:2297 length:285 start_codon:yes stop_codon:yes gene_type:complete
MTIPKTIKTSMFKVYSLKYKGKDSLSTYLKNIDLFFEITLDSYIFGDLTRSKKYGGGQWDSRQEALSYWGDLCKLNAHQISIYFRSVDDVTHYS